MSFAAPDSMASAAHDLMASAAPDPMTSAAPNPMTAAASDAIAPVVARTQVQFFATVESGLGGEISRQLAEQLVLAPEVMEVLDFEMSKKMHHNYNQRNRRLYLWCKEHHPGILFPETETDLKNLGKRRHANPDKKLSSASELAITQSLLKGERPAKYAKV